MKAKTFVLLSAVSLIGISTVVYGELIKYSPGDGKLPKGDCLEMECGENGCVEDSNGNYVGYCCGNGSLGSDCYGEHCCSGGLVCSNPTGKGICGECVSDESACKKCVNNSWSYPTGPIDGNLCHLCNGSGGTTEAAPDTPANESGCLRCDGSGGIFSVPAGTPISGKDCWECDGQGGPVGTTDGSNKDSEGRCCVNGVRTYDDDLCPEPCYVGEDRYESGESFGECGYCATPKYKGILMRDPNPCLGRSDGKIDCDTNTWMCVCPPGTEWNGRKCAKCSFDGKEYLKDEDVGECGYCATPAYNKIFVRVPYACADRPDGKTGCDIYTWTCVCPRGTEWNGTKCGSCPSIENTDCKTCNTDTWSWDNITDGTNKNSEGKCCVNGVRTFDATYCPDPRCTDNGITYNNGDTIDTCRKCNNGKVENVADGSNMQSDGKCCVNGVLDYNEDLGCQKACSKDSDCDFHPCGVCCGKLYKPPKCVVTGHQRIVNGGKQICIAVDTKDHRRWRGAYDCWEATTTGYRNKNTGEEVVVIHYWPYLPGDPYGGCYLDGREEWWF